MMREGKEFSTVHKEKRCQEEEGEGGVMKKDQVFVQIYRATDGGVNFSSFGKGGYGCGYPTGNGFRNIYSHKEMNN